MMNGTPDLEHEALLAAIGRALGQGAPYEELHGRREDAINLATGHRSPAGMSREVLGGAVDALTGRVAWVEQQSGEPEGGYVPVDIDVHFAWDGQPRGTVPVPTYNPYFGCQVAVMRWYGDALVVIYREKHKLLAVRFLPPSGTLELAVLDDTFAIDGDTVYFASHHPGLLEGRLLPSLVPALPLPIPASSQRTDVTSLAPGTLGLVPWPPRGDEEAWSDYRARVKVARESPLPLPLPPPDARALIVSPERLWARLGELLSDTAPARYGVDVLAGAVATPFWRDEVPPSARYHTAPGRWLSPRYLPVYWYQHLAAEHGAEQAAAWLQWLERVAAIENLDPAPWTRGEGGEDVVARTALLYLRARAAVLVEVCRTGQLPEREHCHLFSKRGESELLANDAAYPAGFREVLRQVSARSPKPLPSPY